MARPSRAGRAPLLRRRGRHRADGRVRLAHMRAVLGDKFVPSDDPERSNQCARCAAIVANGAGFRDWPGYARGAYFCERYLRLRIDGKLAVKDCRLRDSHDGPHRASDGAEWMVGVDDYVPASHELDSRITEAS